METVMTRKVSGLQLNATIRVSKISNSFRLYPISFCLFISFSFGLFPTEWGFRELESILWSFSPSFYSLLFGKTKFLMLWAFMRVHFRGLSSRFATFYPVSTRIFRVILRGFGAFPFTAKGILPLLLSWSFPFSSRLLPSLTLANEGATGRVPN